MRYQTLLFIGTSLAAIAVAGCKCPPTSDSRDSVVGANDASRFAYGVGYSRGEAVRDGLAADGLSADANLVSRGFEDALHKRTPAMPKQELDRVLRSVHRMMLDRTAQKEYADDPAFRQLADTNAANSAKAVQAFAALPGARQIEPGVYAITLTPGNGSQPATDEIYIADLTLALSSGEVIDDRKASSVDPDALLPIASRVLRSMRIGDHWKITFAPEQAFGLGGDAPAIGPNEALFLDVTITGKAKREATP